jgi:hypothetical protein
MRLNREKVNHIAKLIVEDFNKDDRVGLLQEANDTRIHVFKMMLDQLTVEDEIDGDVRRILGSYSKKIEEGTRDWDIMYAKLFEEELNKRKL